MATKWNIYIKCYLYGTKNAAGFLVFSSFSNAMSSTDNSEKPLNSMSWLYLPKSTYIWQILRGCYLKCPLKLTGHFKGDILGEFSYVDMES